VTADLPLTDLGSLATVGLAEVVDKAAALHRTDRKYVVPSEVAAGLVRFLSDDHRVLSIDGRLATSYRSTYFDTADLRTCRDHMQGRRRRWKARSRLYVEDALCRLEVKVKSTRGTTLKAVAASSPARYGRLGEDERVSVDAMLGDFGFANVALRPSLEVRYQRATLANLDAGSRVTLDTGLVSTRTDPASGADSDGHVSLDDAFTVVETKGGPLPGRADRFLVAAGHRPRTFSKYVASASLLHPDLPDNDVRRMLGRQLHRTGRALTTLTARTAS
jgi:hypothetical protein